MKRYLKRAGALSVATALVIGMVGCSSNSSSEDVTSDGEQSIQGYFVDSAVAGLNYTCSSGTSGVTDALGMYECIENDTVDFYLGDMLLGTTNIAKYITPLTLFPNNEKAALNLARLLQTLDNDKIVENGITVNTKLLEKLSNVDFLSESFAIDVQKMLGDTLLVSEEDAKEHLNETLLSLDIVDVISNDEKNETTTAVTEEDVVSVTTNVVTTTTTQPAQAEALDGTAIDGILVGSTVCIDTNDNGLCADEVATDKDITDDKGKFQITSTSKGPLVLLGGIDSGTGEAFTGALSAPAGSTVVTPLTSAVQSLISSGSSASDAENSIKAAFGLPDVDLTNFDPFEEIDGDNSATAQTILAKQTQLQIIVHTATVTVAGADTGTDVNSTMNSVFDAIVGNLEGATQVVELTADSVEAATKEVADEIYADNASARVAAKIVAESAAEDAVRDANSAQEIISSGAASEAVDNLNDAITKVNTTTEDAMKQASEDAAANAGGLTADELEEIERLQREREATQAAIAATEQAAEQAAVALAAAQAQAENDLESYKAFLAAKAVAEQAAAEQAAAEQAAAEAKAAAAAEEKRVLEAKAAEEAEARAAAEAAAAAAAEAEARQAAAEAEAAAAAQEASLADAKAAAAAAAALELQNLAIAKATTYSMMAYNFATQAQNDVTEIVKEANATEILANSFPDIDLSAAVDAVNTAVNTAEDSANLALNKANETNATIATIEGYEANATADIESALSDANITQTAAFNAMMVAATQLVVAQETKATAELEIAKAQAFAEKLERIGLLVANVNKMQNDVHILLDNNASDAISTMRSEIKSILVIYDDYSAVLNGSDIALANSASDEASLFYAAAEKNVEVLDDLNATISQAFVDANESAALVFEDNATKQLLSFELNFANITKNTSTVHSVLESVEAVKVAEDSRIVALIEANQQLISSYIVDANRSLLAANEAKLVSNGAITSIDGYMSVDGNPDLSTYLDEAILIDTNVSTIYTTIESQMGALELITAGIDENSSNINVQTALELKNSITVNTGLVISETSKITTILANVEALLEVEGYSLETQNAIATIEAFDPANDSLSDTLVSIKSTLDPENKDDNILLAIIDIAEVLNSDEVAALVKFMSVEEDGTETELTNSILDIVTQDMDAELVVKMASSATTAGGVGVLHTLADKLKSASDTISSAFENGEKHFTYQLSDETINFNLDDSLVMRAHALSTASILDTIASYSYGDAAQFEVKEKEIDGEVYEYTESSVDPLPMFQQAEFFKMSDTERLVGAGNYLTTAVNLLSEVNASAVTITEIDNESISEAQRVRDILAGDGIVDNNETNESVNLHNFFSTDNYIDRDDFNIPTVYMGESDDVIDEFTKVVAFDYAMAEYKQSLCRDEDNATEPSADDINFALAYAQREDTEITLNRDASIVFGNPVYSFETYSHYWVNDDCEIENDDNDARFEAEFEITPKDISAVTNVDFGDEEFTQEIIEGKTFYIAIESEIDGNKEFSEMTISFETDSYNAQTEEGNVTGNYAIVNGLLELTDENEKLFLYSLNDVDGEILNASMLNEYHRKIATLTYFPTQEQLDEYMPEFILFEGTINFTNFDGETVTEIPENIKMEIIPEEDAWDRRSSIDIAADGSYSKKVYILEDGDYNSSFPMKLFVSLNGDDEWGGVESGNSLLFEAEDMTLDILSEGLDVKLLQEVSLFGYDFVAIDNNSKMEAISLDINGDGEDEDILKITGNIEYDDYISTNTKATSIKYLSKFDKNEDEDSGSAGFVINFEDEVDDGVRGDAIFTMHDDYIVASVSFDDSEENWDSSEQDEFADFNVSEYHIYEFKLEDNKTISFYLDDNESAIFSVDLSESLSDNVAIKTTEISFNGFGEAYITDVNLTK